ncbi:hypothetical protein [Schumannella sp. 10F1B-5-1]|uniref:hypothetical protein n=1 Tax=Schumannella sp. 10F1B-5-1 TaxID=2590780 RepID=UPI001130AD8E|nr:hypothetical protein [Schumannella sp. 10F1B-5-1]TPW70676.1 hypothetical protein FJ658_11095 [Schumannella sp. 10F1B-5-1]
MTTAPLFRRVLRDGAILALVVAVLGGGIGLIAAGLPGLWGGLIGAVLAAVFLALTAASVLLAGRATGGDLASPVFFGIVLGVWLLKLVLFLVLSIVLRGQPWLNPYVFFAAVVVAVLGSLVIDVVAFQKSRVPYVDAPLPGEPTGTDVQADETRNGD